MSDRGPCVSQECLARVGLATRVPPFPAALEGRFLRLEPVVPERDCEALFAASNGSDANGRPGAYDAELRIWRYMFGGPYADPAEFLAYLQALLSNPIGLALCVSDKASGRKIGLATYCNNVPKFLSIELGGIWYNPDFHRTYANSETMLLMLSHAFETLGYRRLEWKCDSLNKPSRTAALRLGFQFEGIFRQHMIVKGRNRDTAWYAITDSQWPEVRQALEARLYAGA